MTTISKLLERFDKEFLEFYWEDGKYEGRELGPKAHKKFYRQQILLLVKEIKKELPKKKMSIKIGNKEWIHPVREQTISEMEAKLDKILEVIEKYK